jgi:hypothetical protein
MTNEQHHAGARETLGVRVAGAWARFRCDTLDWHRPGTPCLFNGPNLIGHCQRCRRRICRDSQGNWFALRARTNPGDDHG